MIKARLMALFNTHPLDGDEDYVRAGYLSSLGVIRLIVNIEKEFGVEITTRDMMSKEFRTLNGLIKIIEGK